MNMFSEGRFDVWTLSHFVKLREKWQNPCDNAGLPQNHAEGPNAHLEISVPLCDLYKQFHYFIA